MQYILKILLTLLHKLFVQVFCLPFDVKQILSTLLKFLEKRVFKQKLKGFLQVNQSSVGFLVEVTKNGGFFNGVSCLFCFAPPLILLPVSLSAPYCEHKYFKKFKLDNFQYHFSNT